MNKLIKSINKPVKPIHLYTFFAYSFGLVVYAFIGLPKVYAEPLDLSIAPSIFQIETTPPADARAPFTVTNKGSKAVDLKIILKPFRPAAEGNGEIEYLTGSTPGFFKNIQIVDDNKEITTLSLGPKQEKKLKLRVVVPEKENYADYYFSVVFLAQPKAPENTSKVDEKNNFSTAQGGIAANVLLSIGTNNQSQAYLEEFSAPMYVDSGPVPFTIKVKNMSSHYISPKGTIIIKNMYGQKIGRIDIPPTNILTGTTRALIDLEQAATNAAQIHQESPTAIWPEKFLLGFYQADLRLVVSDNGPLYNKTITFIAFPFKLLLGITIGVILITIIYFRVKKRLQME